MFILNQIFKFLKMLHSETSTNQLASGFVLGMFMGLTPAATLLFVSYWLLLLLLRINMGAAFISFAIFKIWAYIFDPQFDQLGRHILTEMADLKPTFVTWFNMPVVPFTYFYNTVVMGSFVAALVLAIPLFFLSNVLIKKYRATVVQRFKTTWLFRAWSSSKLYGLYVKYHHLRG